LIRALSSLHTSEECFQVCGVSSYSGPWETALSRASIEWIGKISVYTYKTDGTLMSAELTLARQAWAAAGNDGLCVLAQEPIRRAKWLRGDRGILRAPLVQLLVATRRARDSAASELMSHVLAGVAIPFVIRVTPGSFNSFGLIACGWAYGSCRKSSPNRRPREVMFARGQCPACAIGPSATRCGVRRPGSNRGASMATLERDNF
jgi:hypothetical protein